MGDKFAFPQTPGIQQKIFPRYKKPYQGKKAKYKNLGYIWDKPKHVGSLLGGFSTKYCASEGLKIIERYLTLLVAITVHSPGGKKQNWGPLWGAMYKTQKKIYRENAKGQKGGGNRCALQSLTYNL